MGLNPASVWNFLSCECHELSRRGLCVGLISRTERVLLSVVCLSVIEGSHRRGLGPVGLSGHQKKVTPDLNYLTIIVILWLKQFRYNIIHGASFIVAPNTAASSHRKPASPDSGCCRTAIKETLLAIVCIIFLFCHKSLDMAILLSFSLFLIFILPYIVIYSYSTANKMQLLSQIIYSCKKLYIFRTIFPSVIRSSKLRIQQRYMSKSCCYLLLSGMRWNCSFILSPIAAGSSSSLTYTVAVYAVLRSWWRTERPFETYRAFKKNK